VALHFIECTQTPATEVCHESQRRDAQGRRLVSPDTPVTELAKLMREHDIGAIPIGEDDQLIGVVTDRDIV
jgi:predicted transcriptional regulator